MYGKLFSSMYEGSLCGQWEALITMQQLVILSDSEGFVEMTIPAISRRTSIPLPILEKGIRILEKEDDDSRTPDENGKRILRIDPDRKWGWFIVNHAKYKNMARYTDRQKYMREYMQKRRQSL